MNWPRQLDRFPLFTTLWVAEDGTCEGNISTGQPFPKAGDFIYLAQDFPDVPYGDVVSSDPATGRIVLKFYPGDCPPVGSSFPLVNGYHNAYDVLVVLDENRRWTRTRFVPSDASTGAGPDGFQCVRPLGNHGNTSRFYPIQSDAVPGDAPTVLRGGWDHEHCFLCMATISVNEQAEGYVDDGGRWVCCDCYEAYVTPHDLGFITG